MTSPSSSSSAFRAFPLHEHVPTARPAPSEPMHIHYKRRILWWVLGSIVVLLVILRLAAPWLLTSYLNKELAGLADFQGHVESTSLSLYRGAFQIRHITMVSRPPISPALNVTCEDIDITLIWRRLFHGQLVGTVTLYRPVATVTTAAASAPPPPAVAPVPAIPADNETWQQELQGLLPILVPEIQIVSSQVVYRDAAHGIDMPVCTLTLGLTNLTNRAQLSPHQNTVITITATGTIAGEGKLDLNGEVDPYPPLPTFALHLSVTNTDLTAYNELLRTYGKIDLRHGAFSGFTEMHCDQGHLQGYLKPLVTGVQTEPLKEAKRKGLSVVKEAVVSATDTLLKNTDKNRVAGQIPLHGDLTDPKTRIWPTVASILGNGFIRALEPDFDHKQDEGDKPLPTQEPATSDSALQQAQSKSDSRAK